jgi:hypothetical protein
MTRWGIKFEEIASAPQLHELNTSFYEHLSIIESDLYTAENVARYKIKNNINFNPFMVEFIFRQLHAVAVFEIKANGKHWTSFHTRNPQDDKERIIEKAKKDLMEEGISTVEINYKCPWW